MRELVIAWYSFRDPLHVVYENSIFNERRNKNLHANCSGMSPTEARLPDHLWCTTTIKVPDQLHLCDLTTIQVGALEFRNKGNNKIPL